MTKKWKIEEYEDLNTFEEWEIWSSGGEVWVDRPKKEKDNESKTT